ncbi:hypothetical protein [Haloparvum sp. PAK95]
MAHERVPTRRRGWAAGPPSDGAVTVSDGADTVSDGPVSLLEATP